MIDIKKSIRSFSYAFKGINHLVRLENNARIHLIASVLIIILGCITKIDKNEWLWIFLAITLVWITEALNTAIEKIIDLYTPHHDPKAGIIKDLSSGAVLIASLFSVIVSIIIFYPRYFN